MPYMLEDKGGTTVSTSTSFFNLLVAAVLLASTGYLSFHLQSRLGTIGCKSLCFSTTQASFSLFPGSYVEMLILAEGLLEQLCIICCWWESCGRCCTVRGLCNGLSSHVIYYLLLQGRNGAIAVIAVAERGALYSPGPVMYMEKLAVGPAVDARRLSLNYTVKQNLQEVNHDSTGSLSNLGPRRVGYGSRYG